VSEENVEVVRLAWEATVRRDYETALSLYDPEVTLEPGFLDSPELFRGLDGVREVFRNWFGVFADMTSTVEEWIDAGDDVVAMLRLSGRGRQSGVPVVRLEAHVWTVRDGKLWRLRIFRTREEALKAVGLEP
jgi:ketosteroid isomerase-like protein